MYARRDIIPIVATYHREKHILSELYNGIMGGWSVWNANIHGKAGSRGLGRGEEEGGGGGGLVGGREAMTPALGGTWG